MTAELPAPPVPAFVDLRHYRDMPLEVQTLLDSTIAGVGDAEIFRCAVLLWAKSWQQVPCGSLEDDDSTLARACGLGRDLKTWRRLKDQVLRGFRKASDGRLYHWKVCTKAAESWNNTALWSWNKACDALRKVNKGRKDAGQEPLPMPEKPVKVSCGWGKDGPIKGDGNDDPPTPVSGGNGGGHPPISGGASAGNPPENAGREEEGNRKGILEEEDSAAAAARAGDGPGLGAGEGQERRSPDPPPPKPRTAGKPEDQAFALWQAAAAQHGWPEAGFLTSTRRMRLGPIMTACGGVPGFEAALDRATTAEFLHDQTGHIHGWFDFDWLLDEQHFARLMEGRYDQRHATTRANNGQGGQPQRRTAAANTTLFAAAYGGVGDRGSGGGGG